MERSKVKEVTSQQNQIHQGQRMEQRGAEGDNLNSISNNVEAPSTDLSSMAVATIPTASDASAAGSTVGPGDKSAKKNSTEQVVDKIREYDVLMGRGSGPNRHSGNIHFRAIVGEVFDDFLSKHGSDRTMIGDSGSDMLRIDPSTKNRLAQAVLDKITIEKKGRFLQKLNKKELSEAIKKGDDKHLIKARAFSLMDAAMANTVTPESVAEKEEGDDKDESQALEKCGGFNPNAVVYYRIIPEKQILAKIKQTFRFLRDQNEASNAEKHRQRARRVAAASMGGVPRDQFSAAALGGVGGMQLPGGLAGGLASSNSMAYALMQRMGVDGLNINPNPLPDQLNYANSRGLNNIIAPAPSITMSAIKNLNQSNPPVGAMDLASRLLIDLPQPKRIISTSEQAPPPSLLQGSALAAAVSQLDGSNNAGKVVPPMDNSTKRLLEELTLSRLANLQKQREDTISAFLAMERSSSGGAPSSAGIGNAASQMNGATLSPSALPAQQLQRLLSLNSASPAPLAMAPASNLQSSSASEPLSLLLQLNNGSNGAMNGNTMGRAPGNHSLRAFNSSSF